MYQDIHNKTGYRNLQGNGYLYGNLKLLSEGELANAKLDGITDYVAPTKPLPTQAQQLEQAKVAKKKQIRSEFDVFNLEPVIDINSIAWAGGYDSATKLDAARRLAGEFGLAEVTLYADDNSSHTLSLPDALVVVGTVANSYQTALGLKNSLYGDVDVSLDITAVGDIVSPWSIL